MNNIVAEVVKSSLKEFTATAWDYKIFPEFGSLVCIDSGVRKIYAIVYNIETGSSDSSRMPFVFKKSEEDLLIEQPQIFHFLSTNFFCINLGYKELDKIFYQVLPEPAKIHSCVYKVNETEASLFFSDPAFLHSLFSFYSPNLFHEDLLLAILKNVNAFEKLQEYYISNFIDHYSLLINNDYKRLKIFLQRVSLII